MWKRTLLYCVATAAFMIAMPTGVTHRADISPAWATAEAATARISISFLFDALDPYGSWVQTERHPYVFVPANVGEGWAPYVNGHWIYIENSGWYFESDEPFASITYHYGRWAYDPDIGWYWVAGTVWAPAWVVWREGDGYIGWAPIPPPDNGYAIEVDVRVVEVPESYWVLVPADRFLEPQLSVVVQFGARHPEIVRQTKVVGPVKVENNVVVNNVIDIDFIQQATKKEVVIHEVEVVEDPKQAQAAEETGTVKVFTAEVEQPDESAKPKKVREPREAKAEQTKGEGAAAKADKAPPPAAGDAAKSAAPAEDAAATADTEAKPAGEAAKAPAAPAEGEEATGTAARPQTECTAAEAKANPERCKPAEGAAEAQPSKQPAAAAKKAEPKPAAKEGEGAAIDTEATGAVAPKAKTKPDAGPAAKVPAEPEGEGSAASAPADDATNAAKAPAKPAASGEAAKAPADEEAGDAAAAPVAKEPPASAAEGKPASCTPQQAKADPANCPGGNGDGQGASAAPAEEPADQTGSVARDGEKKPAEGSGEPAQQ